MQKCKTLWSAIKSAPFNQSLWSNHAINNLRFTHFMSSKDFSWEFCTEIKTAASWLGPDFNPLTNGIWDHYATAIVNCCWCLKLVYESIDWTKVAMTAELKETTVLGGNYAAIQSMNMKFRDKLSNPKCFWLPLISYIGGNDRTRRNYKLQNVDRTKGFIRELFLV